MKRLLICLLAFIPACLSGQGVADPPAGTIRFRVVDHRAEPVFGVYVYLHRHEKLLTTSDIDGECTLSTASFSPTDTIGLLSVGFHTRTFSGKELAGLQEIRLEPLSFELDEARVTAIPVKDLLAKAMEHLKKLPRRTPPYPNFYGKAQYEKITEYRNKALEYRREYGYYFTSGDLQPRDVWDQHFVSYFVPAWSARSYNLNNSGSDTLSPLYITSGELRYDAGTRKLFTLLRAVQLYGPLFSGTQTYDIAPVESDSPDYVFSFSTRPADYPEKTRITCKGTLVIDIEKHLLKTISFDFIDYQLFRQALLSRERKTGSPFSTRAEIEIAYDDTHRPYFRRCRMDTYWKHNLDDRFVIIEQPSRIRPAAGNLVEREAYACYSYREMPGYLQKKETTTRIHAIQRNPAGEYNPALFEELPQLLDESKARQDLYLFGELEKQFRQLSGVTYYPDNHLIGFNGTARSNRAFRENITEVRKHFFELFPPPSYP